MTENKIRHWLNGRSKSARPDHLRYVIRAWEELPRYEFVENPADEIAEMRRLKEETGFGFSALLSGQREEMPEGLRADIIKGWFENTRVKARRDHLDYVLARWRSLRDDGRVRLAILPDHIDELRGHIERTGVSIKQLLANADDVPGGLSLPMLRSWFTESPPMLARNIWTMCLRVGAICLISCRQHRKSLESRRSWSSKAGSHSRQNCCGG